MKSLTIKKGKKDKKSRKKVLTKGECFGIINERQARAKRERKYQKRFLKKVKKCLT